MVPINFRSSIIIKIYLDIFIFIKNLILISIFNFLIILNYLANYLFIYCFLLLLKINI